MSEIIVPVSKIRKEKKLEEPQQKFEVRKAKPEEFGQMAYIAAESYIDRFFREERIDEEGKKILEREGLCQAKKEEEKKKEEEREKKLKSDMFQTREEELEYYGSLSTRYPKLTPQPSGAGQSPQFFQRYWEGKKQDFEDGKFKVYVAVSPNGEIMGFIKGTFDNFDFATDLPAIPEIETFKQKKNVGETTSTYVLPKYRNVRGIGTELVRKFCSDLRAENPNSEGKLFGCYDGNNSQWFFNSIGAYSIGYGNIPNQYLDSSGDIKTQNIGGEFMFLSREAMDDLIDRRLVKEGLAYTRNTPEGSLIKVVRGDMDEFVKVKNFNLSELERYKKIKEEKEIKEEEKEIMGIVL